MDQSKKTMRHFYCRDVLWETFEQMANDFDCSIDYLINESMRYYARSKNYQSMNGPATSNPSLSPPGGAPRPSPGSQPGGFAGGPPPMGPATLPPNAGQGGYGGAAAQPGRSRPAPATNPPPAPNSSANQVRRAAAPTPSVAGSGPAPAGSGAGVGRAPAAAPSAPPPGFQASNGSQPGGAPGADAATLYLFYNGQKYPVTKDQFIIGRGSKTSDLAIKDGNISRKHAAVIRRNGTFYIKDLGSTNGIDFKGMRIDNKRIDEGDVFHLCDYELRFSYRPD